MASSPRWQQVGGTAAEIYERQLVPAMFAPLAPVLIEAAGVQPGDHVLDVACGTGVVTVLAADAAGETGRVVGVDYSAAMLGVARSVSTGRGASIEWLEANALDLPLPDGTFDVVVCQQGLQQFPDRPLALREMLRVLKPGGRFAASVWAQIEGSPGMAALVDALERHVSVEAANNRRAPFALGDAEELRGLCVGAGMLDVDVRTLVADTRFPSPEAFVAVQFAATPLSTLGALSADTRRAVAHDVRAALQPFVHHDGLVVPMEAHLALAHT